MHGLVAGRSPALDLELERDVQAVVREAVHDGLLASTHDLSEGGVAVALAECCIAGDIGAKVALDDDLPAHSSLFSESQSRFVVSVADSNSATFIKRLIEAEVPYSVIGEVGGTALEIEGRIAVEVAEIAHLYDSILEQLVTKKSA